MRRSLCEQEGKQEDKKTTCEKAKQQTKMSQLWGEKSSERNQSRGQTVLGTNKQEGIWTNTGGGWWGGFNYLWHTQTHSHVHNRPPPPPPAHTMMAQSQVQTRACIWNQEWIHITCVVCCLSGSGPSIMNRNIQAPQAGRWCLCTCKGFLKRGDWHAGLSFTCTARTWETEGFLLSYAPTPGEPPSPPPRSFHLGAGPPLVAPWSRSWVKHRTSPRGKKIKPGDAHNNVKVARRG